MLHRVAHQSSAELLKVITSRFSAEDSNEAPKLCAEVEGKKSDLEDRLQRFPLIHQVCLLASSR